MRTINNFLYFRSEDRNRDIGSDVMRVREIYVGPEENVRKTPWYAIANIRYVLCFRIVKGESGEKHNSPPRIYKRKGLPRMILFMWSIGNN